MKIDDQSIFFVFDIQFLHPSEAALTLISAQGFRQMGGYVIVFKLK